MVANRKVFLGDNYVQHLCVQVFLPAAPGHDIKTMRECNFNGVTMITTSTLYPAASILPYLSLEQ
jgi:hypothetical protein